MLFAQTKLNPPLVDKSGSRGSSVSCSLHFHFPGATRLDKFDDFNGNTPIKSLNLPGMKSARMERSFFLSSHFSLPQEPMMITFLQVIRELSLQRRMQWILSSTE